MQGKIRLPKTKKEVLDKNIFFKRLEKKDADGYFLSYSLFHKRSKEYREEGFFLFGVLRFNIMLKDGKYGIKNIVPRLDNDENDDDEDRQARVVDMNLFDTEEITNKLLIVFRDQIKANESLLEGNYGKRRAGA